MRRLSALVLVCSAAWCQDQAAQYFGSKATPADLSISCRVNGEARTVTVVIGNQTEKQRYLQSWRTADDMENYEISVTTTAGKRLPPPKKPIPQFRIESATLIPLAPKEERTEKFALSDLVALPEKGGRFQIRIGRKLSTGDSSSDVVPSQVLWCKPMDVTFPPLKQDAGTEHE